MGGARVTEGLGEEQPWLVQVRGPRPAVHRSLEDVRELVFGRAPDCGVVLSDRDASRRHARLVHEDGRVVLEDLGSTNGTQVNGERLRGPRELRDNDLIELGGAVFRFLRARSLVHAMRDTL